MKIHRPCCICFLLVVVLLFGKSAHAARLVTFGNSLTSSIDIFELSDYGGIFVGQEFSFSTNAFTAFRGTSDGAMFGLVPGGAFGVSADGSVIVGAREIEFDGQTTLEAFRWSADTGPILLGRPPGPYSQSSAEAVSPDGKTVVGSQTKATVVVLDNGAEQIVNDPTQARIWPGDTVEPLPDTQANGFSAISGGSVRTGSSWTTSLSQAQLFEPFWNNVGGSLGLGHLPGVNENDSPPPQTVSNDISSDGRFIVGSGTNSQGNTEAFRWSFDTGMVGLGTIPNRNDIDSYALATSGDGSVVVGNTEGNGFGYGFYRTATGGMKDVREVLQQAGVDVTGFQAFEVSAVSANGLTIAGKGEMNGTGTAWIAQLPQIVGLAWDVDVPVNLTPVVDALGRSSIVSAAGTMPALAIDEATRSDLRHRVRDIFTDSGINNVLLVNGKVEGGINVYFADRIPGAALNGRALSGVDQFN